ncbi:MAG: hypothetical protein H6555_04440 [Lewinellaceae bacterium]|nr:hypothetical protein [Lewinellaceae bacterium]
MASSYPVVQHMQVQIDQWASTGDPRATFLRCYALMTNNMLSAIEAGRFQDPAWVKQLLQHFAEYYFQALTQYEKDSPETPVVWRYTFNETCHAGHHVLQRLLLGINAHINYDLTLCLWDILHNDWFTLSPGIQQQRFADHCLVNTIIAETIDIVQDTVIEVEDPRWSILDDLLGRLDERLLSALITHWRQQVWQQALQLIEAPTSEERQVLRQQLEKHALQRAQRICLL